MCAGTGIHKKTIRGSHQAICHVTSSTNIGPESPRYTMSDEVSEQQLAVGTYKGNKIY